MDQASGNNEHKLLYVGFNQHQNCFLISMNGGFRIYTSDPFAEKGSQFFKKGGICHIEALSNYVALVGGGMHPLDSPNRVAIWDTIEKTTTIYMDFHTPVKAVRLCHKYVVVIFFDIIKVLTFTRKPLELAEFQTVANPNGICALSTHRKRYVLAIPGREVGQVQIIHMENLKSPPLEIQAHQAALSCIAFNLNATRLATASERGTLIRVYDVSTKNMVAELRRGHTQANIYCINFNISSTMVVASSDHGTIHVFKLMENTYTSMYYYMPQYFSSQSSFVKLSLPKAGQRSVCAFGPDASTIIIVCEDGNYYKFSFTEDGQSKLQVHRELHNHDEYDFV